MPWLGGALHSCSEAAAIAVIAVIVAAAATATATATAAAKIVVLLAAAISAFDRPRRAVARHAWRSQSSPAVIRAYQEG